MPAPPTIPVISFMSPAFGDTMLTEAHNTELGAYRELPIGTPHPDAGKYPNFVLIHQQPFAGDEKWIQRFWTADEILPETFNLKSRTYDGEDITKDIYERNYAYRRKDYEPATKLVNFKGVLYVRRLLAGTGYDNTATVAFSGGGGSSQATGVPIVFRGSIYGVRLTSEGAGYTSAPTLTFSAPVSGVTATGTAVLQNPLAVLTDERADRMEGDPMDGVYLKITRIYRVLPGAILYKYFYDEQKGAVEQSAQLVAATGNEQGSVAISALTGTISAIRLDANGSGYTSAPGISFTGGGGGTGLAATAVLSSRQVATLPIANAGSGYTSAPAVTISGGGGTGATATAVLNSTSVNTLTLATAGSGYSGALTVRISGDGSGATGTATYGVTTASFSVTPNTGRYSSAPTLTFGPGTGATGTCLLGVSSQSFTFTTPGTNQYSAVPSVAISGGTGATATPLMGVSASSFTVTGNTTTYSVAPTVTITSGGGAGATATATLSGGGVVNGITITAPGTGFTSAPTITFTGGTVLVAGTDPTGTGNTTNFIAVGATVVLPGTGFSFSSAPTIVFSGGTLTFTGTTTVASGNTTNFVIVGVTVTSSGSGFTSAIPTLTFSAAPSGTTPTATGNATNFVIGSVTKTASGSGYTTTPTAIFISTNGTGGTITVALNTTSVASLTITSAGDDFTSAPVVTIDAPASGTTATCTAPTITTASIQSITVDTAGSGYTTAPGVVFASGTATATAIIGAYVIETKYDQVSTVVLRKIVEKWVIPGPTVNAPSRFEDESGSRITQSKTLRKTSDIVNTQTIVGSALRIIETADSGISTLISLENVTTYARATHYSLGTAKISQEMRPYQFPGTVDVTLVGFLGLLGSRRATAILTPHLTYEFWVNSLLEPVLALEEIIPGTIWILGTKFDNVLYDAVTLTYLNSGGGSTAYAYAATTPSFSTYSSAWIGTLRAVDGGVKPLRVYRWKAQLTFVRMR